MKDHHVIVGIDSQILMKAYSIDGMGEESKSKNVFARNFVEDLLTSGTAVCLSIVTVAEYLVKVDDTRKAATLKFIEQTFEIAPFNLQAAMIASQLVPMAKTLVVGDRPVLFADTKIIGSLIAKGVQVIYSDDEKFRKLALSHSRCKQCEELPKVQLKLDLPLQTDAKTLS